MLKPMEFPTEWTLPDPVDARETKQEEQPSALPQAQSAATFSAPCQVATAVAAHQSYYSDTEPK